MNRLACLAVILIATAYTGFAQSNRGETEVAMCWGSPWVLSDTSQWGAVYQRLDVLKIYVDNIDARADTAQVRAFVAALLEQDIRIAIELGGLLDWHADKGEQTAAASFQQEYAKVLPLITLIQDIDPARNIAMLDMDGPIRRMLFPHKKKQAYHTVESAVEELAKVVQLWRDAIPGLRINLLTNFPNWAWDDTPAYFAIDGHSDGFGHYRDVLDAIAGNPDLELDGLTIDNPYNYATGTANTNQPEKIAGVDWMKRLAALHAQARTMGLRVNMIFNSNGARTAEAYSAQTLALIDLYHQQVGQPDGYWIQSWYPLPGAWLPESTPYTMTHLTREAMTRVPGIETEDRRYWGLRNIDAQLPGGVYTALNPQYVAWGFQWDRLERPDDTFHWSNVDNAVDFTANLGAKAVLLLTPSSSWASGGEPRAPDDLDRTLPLSATPPQRGYSESLYDYTYRIIERVAQRNPSVLGYLRYGNEPQYPDHWITTEQTYTRDVEDYIRCLRTAYLAAHRAAADNNAHISVSHGGFYYYAQLEREWFAHGEAHVESQDSLLTLFSSHYERQWPKPLASWNEFRRRMQGRTGIPPTYWMDAIAGQSAWLDWFDIHYHFKPRYLVHNMKAFERAVQDSGGTLKPWLAAEAAMQIEAQGETQYEERFHAGDMVRKWITGIAAGLNGICTPIVGWPPDRFFGLYADRGQRYLSADAYAFVHAMIAPAGVPEDLGSDGIAAYRFREKEIVDVLWMDALFDTVTVSTPYHLPVPVELRSRPDGPLEIRLYDVLGRLQDRYPVPGDGIDLAIVQEPVLIAWGTETQSDTGRTLLEPEDGRVYHGVQTVSFGGGTEDLDGYLAVMDEKRQPAVRGFFFSIPGTRGPAMTLQRLGAYFAEADSVGFIPELSLFLTDGASTDSIIAVSDTYDALIDSIITLSMEYGKRMFLRIGGEFNGGWNGYHPHLYVDMFRKITDMFDARGFRDSIATIWCYMPAGPNTFDSVDVAGALWYPGDEYADWFGLDVFDANNFDQALPDYDRKGITTKGKSECFLAMARAKNKPVYMSETSAIRINISSDPDDGVADWDAWFEKFWEFIAVHEEIKGFSYINTNWPQHAYAGWGDSRIQNSAYVSQKYYEEMRDPRYIHLPWSPTTDIRPRNSYTRGVTLAQNFPNPFNPTTTISFRLPEDGRIILTVTDILGREVVRLIDNEIRQAGEHRMFLDASTLTAGVYLYRLTFRDVMLTRRMLLLR